MKSLSSASIICLPQAIQDSYSGVNLSKGCHNLNGTQALAFVRDRHSFATSDLQRIQDQRAFLKALLSKATSPGVYLNPFTAYPFASTAAGSIAVDKGTSLYDLIQAGLALRGAQTGTVPIANAALPDERGRGRAVEPHRGAAAVRCAAGQQGRSCRAAERHQRRVTGWSLEGRRTRGISGACGVERFETGPFGVSVPIKGRS